MLQTYLGIFRYGLFVNVVHDPFDTHRISLEKDLCTKWNKIHRENLMASSERVGRAFEYAKSLGVDEESNCEACGDIVTPDCENNHCIVCGYFKGEYLKD